MTFVLPKNLPKRLFITGTDTEIGKTVVSCALLEHFQKIGKSTCALKPVASGCQPTPDGLRNEDALALQQAATIKLPYSQINPWAYLPPISPHLAATPQDQPVTQTNIEQHLSQLPKCDVILIEGAGGWLSPIRHDMTNADLCAAYDAHPILVVGLKLGCINHAHLTAHALKDAPNQPIGWISNVLDPNMQALAENIDYLKNTLGLPYLGEVGYLG